MNQLVNRDVLNEGYTLHWYEIGSVLGRGAFGVTYLARDKNLDQLVAIKEYFPHDFSARDSGYTVHPTTGENRELFEWGLDRFIREAQILAKFKHHNIVRVMSVFELNNTAYMVMEFEQGEELSKLYKRKDQLTEQELLAIFLPILDGLKLVHDAGFIHRDIKPANIYIRDDGSPVVIDFGAARQTVGTPTRAITSLVTYGYAPFEQYNESDEKQGAWTDIYALGACLYYAVSGKLPLDALARGSSLLSTGVDPYKLVVGVNKGQYSSRFLRAIDHALMFHVHDRPQDLLVWSGMLSGKLDTPPVPKELFNSQAGLDGNDATVIRKRRTNVSPQGGVSQSARLTVSKPMPATIKPTGRWKAWITMLFIILLVSGGGYYYYLEKGDQPESVVENVKQKNQDQLISLLKNAEEARKAGKLLRKGDGAIFLYKQILEIDPVNAEATRRIQEIIDLIADGIRSDLAEGFFDAKAQSHVQVLQAVAPKSKTVIDLVEELRSAKAGQQKIPKLLKQANRAFKAGRKISPEDKNALSIYRRILVISPENSNARQGIENILKYYIRLTKKYLKSGDVPNVEKNIKHIITVDPDAIEVKQLRAELQSIESRKRQKSQKRKVTVLLGQASRAFESGDIINPPNKNALSLYHKVLRLERKNTKAKQGILRIEEKLKDLYEEHLSAGNFAAAELVMKDIEKVLSRSRLARDIREDWERRKPSKLTHTS